MTFTKVVSVRLTQEDYDKLICLTKELKCLTISELIVKLLNTPDEVLNKLKVIYRKPIVQEILKRDGIDLKEFDWKNYKPKIEVNACD